MKKYFYSMLAASMLFACSQEEIVNGLDESGKTEKVTFNVGMPSDGGARAIATGVEVGKANMANKLAWALYESGKEDGNPLDTGTANKTADSKEFSVTIDMVKGLQYKVLFLAYNEEGTIFDVTPGDDLKSLNYKSNVVEANQEAYDAFVACHPYNTLGGSEHTVYLTRPFAQINAGTTDVDLQKAAKLGATVTSSQLVIDKVPTQYNVLTGEVSEYKNVTYTKKAILYQAGTTNNEILQSVDGQNYNYLNMAYVLAGNGTSTSSTHVAKFTFYRNDEPQLVRTIDFVNLPIQRNYRTNIVGDLITQTEAFQIIIDEVFDGDNNLNGSEVAATTTSVATADELQKAIDAATGSTIIKFEQDIDANSSRAIGSTELTVVQKPGVSIAIDGCGHKFNGSFKVHANSTRNTGYLVIKNINFETSTKSLYFVNAIDFGNSQRYSQDITIDDCTFTAVAGSEAERTAVGVQVNATQNLKIRNCTATNLHSLLQAQSCDKNIDLFNVTVTNCKNGVSFGNTAAPSITNSTIDVTGYGVRADGDASRGNLIIENTSIKAEKPVIIRKVVSDGYAVALEGENALITNELYQIVFTSGNDDPPFAAPTVNYSITGAAGFNVYPSTAGAPMNANSTEQLESAIKVGATTINLTGGNYVMPELDLRGKSLTLVGTKDAVIDATKVDARNQFVTGATLAFEGVTLNFGKVNYMGFANTASLTYKDCQINGLQFLFGENVTFENCDLNSTGAEHSVWTYGAKNVSFTGCDFTYGDRGINCYSDNDIAGGKQTVNFTNCTFATENTASEGAVEINSCFFSVGIEVNMEGCTAPAYGQMAYVSPWDSTNGAKTTINIK